MGDQASRHTGIIDCHSHMYGIDQAERMLKIREVTGIERMNLLAIQNPEAGTGLPNALYMKARHPDWFYVFAGLNHAERKSEGRGAYRTLAEQADRYTEIGCDGIKMIEGKPTSRQRLPIPVTDPHYAEYFARVEAAGMPILWHVNDPEEFWDPDLIPGWAKERDWGYGPEDVQKEDLYAEVDRVLERHPRLKIIFAHFYFLSADLPRATRFLEDHPTVTIDLAPGIEMLYNISRDPEAGREFFTRSADRIAFGTDIQSSITVEEGEIRAGIVFRWLESDDTFRIPEAADFLLGPPEDGIVRGMALPDDVLSRIYHDNFARIVGSAPRPINIEGTIEESQRLAALAETLTGKPAAQTQAAIVAEALAG